jgi:DNA topoisomerase VI subunit A
MVVTELIPLLSVTNNRNIYYTSNVHRLRHKRIEHREQSLSGDVLEDIHRQKYCKVLSGICQIYIP